MKLNNKYLIITLVLIFCIGTIIAGASLLKTDSKISIDKSKIDVLKTKGIDKINVQASPMTCDTSECWTNVYQDNVIQTQFRTAKSYCSSYSVNDKQCNDLIIDENSTQETIKLKETCDGFIPTCLIYKDYTPEELIKQRDDFVKKRIEGYIDSIIADTSKSANIQIDDGGKITSQ